MTEVIGSCKLCNKHTGHKHNHDKAIILAFTQVTKNGGEGN